MNNRQSQEKHHMESTALYALAVFGIWTLCTVLLIGASHFGGW